MLCTKLFLYLWKKKQHKTLSLSNFTNNKKMKRPLMQKTFFWNKNFLLPQGTSCFPQTLQLVGHDRKMQSLPTLIQILKKPGYMESRPFAIWTLFPAHFIETFVVIVEGKRMPFLILWMSYSKRYLRHRSSHVITHWCF